jgi:hypothetical protein
MWPPPPDDADAPELPLELALPPLEETLPPPIPPPPEAPMYPEPPPLEAETLLLPRRWMFTLIEERRFSSGQEISFDWLR